jgi:hypothetical protein
MSRSPVKRSPFSVASCPLYGISPLLLARTFHLGEDLAFEWKKSLRRDPESARSVAALVSGDLGAFDAAWSGYFVRNGMLWDRDNVGASPGEVSSIPHLKAQLAEYHRAQRWMLERSLSPRAPERSEVEMHLERALAALRRR